MRLPFRLLCIVLPLGGCAGAGGLDDLRAGGDAYQFRGGNPSWTLSIDPRVMIFDDGSTRIAQTAVAPVVENGRRVYRTARVTASATAGRCTTGSDSVSYTESVSVTVDGRSYSGCGGRVLAADQLDGSEWRITSVKGQALAGATMRFEAERFTARLPCSTVSGRYVQSGVIMSVGQIRTVPGTCTGLPVEQDAAMLLNGLITTAWTAADRLTLSHPDGAILLQR